MEAQKRVRAMSSANQLALEQQAKSFVEQVGIQLEELGLPRMAGRVLGWLLVCMPPQQCASDLERAIGGSKAAISTSLQMLARFELVERIGVPGQRSAFYQINAGAWSRHLENKVMQMGAMRRLVERGLVLLDGAPPERRQRLEELHDMYVFFEEEWPAMVERYRRTRADAAQVKGRRR